MGDLLVDGLEDLLDRLDREALKQLMFGPLAAGELDEQLARLARHAHPAYLPFATWDGSPLALHLQPGRELAASPVVLLPSDDHGAVSLADSPAGLPGALWVFCAPYLAENDPDRLRAATDALAAGIAERRPVPEALWQRADRVSDGWVAHGPGNRTVALSESGHPFAGDYDLARRTPRDEAEATLSQLIADRGHPELVGELIALRLTDDAEVPIGHVLEVLRAEAWREWSLGRGKWKVNAQGLSAWSAALAGGEGRLDGTEFAPLAGRPETYSGDDRTAGRQLEAVAAAALQVGDATLAVSQLRNAALVDVLSQGTYAPSLASRIADACDSVESNSAAAAVARRTAAVHSTGP